MKEQLLQFIWRYQYFYRPQLHTEAGEPLQILAPGELNTHQGPDFLNALIRIGNTFWAGNIELHIRTSDWKRHAHQKDKHYSNVILHVVWENDVAAGAEGTEPIGGGMETDNTGSIHDAGGGREADKTGSTHGAGDNMETDKTGSIHDEGGREPIGRKGIGDEGMNRAGDGVGRGSVAERKIPLLVLQDRIPKVLLSKYEEWMNNRSFVACERQLPQVGQSTWSAWKQQLLEERLYRKALFIRDCLEQNQQHWEETTWWLLARNFGFPVNTASFEAVARSLPLRLLARHTGRVEQLEALLLGQAGLLEGDFGEEYPLFLQNEFHYLRKKYRLPVIHPPVLFLRMRPGNFPAIRLAQLAGLLSLSTSWWATIKEADSPEALNGLLAVNASLYWNTHYGLERNVKATEWKVQPFTKPSRPKNLGAQMKESILINTWSPLLYAYGWLRGEPVLRQKALRWLAAVPAEKNALVAGWGRQGVYAKTAMDTQALLELKTRYCDPKKCLECAVGNFLLGEAGAGQDTGVTMPHTGERG